MLQFPDEKEFSLIDEIMRNLERIELRILTGEGYIIDVTKKRFPDYSI